MPTTRPRQLVTETDELAAALDDAAARWPGASRAQLLARLALEGHRALRQRDDERHARRVEALRRHRGTLTGVYEPGALEQLRADWPT